jgi:hypothetical protein
MAGERCKGKARSGRACPRRAGRCVYHDANGRRKRWRYTGAESLEDQRRIADYLKGER